MEAMTEAEFKQEIERRRMREKSKRIQARDVNPMKAVLQEARGNAAAKKQNAAQLRREWYARNIENLMRSMIEELGLEVPR